MGTQCLLCYQEYNQDFVCPVHRIHESFMYTCHRLVAILVAYNAHLHACGRIKNDRPPSELKMLKYGDGEKFAVLLPDGTGQI